MRQYFEKRQVKMELFFQRGPEVMFSKEIESALNGKLFFFQISDPVFNRYLQFPDLRLPLI